MPPLFTPTRPLIRFALLNGALQSLILFLGARTMIHAIRADGGTATEYLFFAFYCAVLLVGAAGATIIAGATSYRAAGAHAERIIAVVLAAAANLALVADVLTFAILGMHPYGRATWAAISSTDFSQMLGGPGTVFAAAAILLTTFAIAAALWTIAARGDRNAPLSPFEARAPRRIALYFACGAITFIVLDSPDDERVIPRAALPFYGLWVAPANRFADARPSFAMNAPVVVPAFTATPDIVVLQAESLRWDALTVELMPNLSRIAGRAGCAAAPTLRRRASHAIRHVLAVVRHRIGGLSPDDEGGAHL